MAANETGVEPYFTDKEPLGLGCDQPSLAQFCEAVLSAPQA